VKQLRAIVIQTMRSAVRSRVFHVLFLFILLAVALLPLVVSGDGTARAQAQITLTYSLGVVVALISTTTLWLGCSQLPREVEDYTIHMVTTKPCPRWIIWVGKWLGVFIMNAAILVVSFLIILSLVHFGLSRKRFDEQQMVRLREEVLVGRRGFEPDRPNYMQDAREEYARKKDAGELEEGHDPDTTLGSILQHMKTRTTGLEAGHTKTWRFQNVNVPKGTENLYLRYRHYLDSTSQSAQKVTLGFWEIHNPNAKGNQAATRIEQRVLTGNYHEVKIPASHISEDGVLEVGYFNPLPEVAKEGKTGEDRGHSVIFQWADGPLVLARVSGFTTNYARAMVLALLQVAFLSALGCAVGAAFSTPVAAFVAIAYLVIGLSVQAAVSAPLQDDFGRYTYKGVADRAAHYLARTVGKVVVSVDDFDATSDLARGRLVEYSRVAWTTLNLIVIRGGLIALFGVWVLTRRELGTVIRR
jgi:hypothetical protein